MKSLVIGRYVEPKLTANMHEVGCGDYLVLVSYNTPVAAMHVDGKAYRTNVVWSPTTTRHINRWLADVADVQEKPQDWFNKLMGGK